MQSPLHQQTLIKSWVKCQLDQFPPFLYLGKKESTNNCGLHKLSKTGVLQYISASPITIYQDVYFWNNGLSAKSVTIVWSRPLPSIGLCETKRGNFPIIISNWYRHFLTIQSKKYRSPKRPCIIISFFFLSCFSHESSIVLLCQDHEKLRTKNIMLQDFWISIKLWKTVIRNPSPHAYTNAWTFYFIVNNFCTLLQKVMVTNALFASLYLNFEHGQKRKTLK